MEEVGKPKIVIVEDEGLIAADLEGRLKSSGYSVSGTADTAERALALIRSTSPDLVLMDIRIKGAVDGIEVADQVRQELDVPVIYLTAYEDTHTLERASRTQAFGYIKKPIASASLKGSIEMALAKHRYERTLRAQKEWATASFQAVPYAVLVTDGEGRVTYLNLRAEELTGYSVNRALGRPCAELLTLYDSQSGAPMYDFVTAAMLEGETVSLPEGICLRRAGARGYAIEGSVAPRWRDGQVEGAVIALKDVTETQLDREQAELDEKQDALQRLAEGIGSQLTGLSQVAEDSPSLLDSLGSGSLMREGVESIERAAIEAFRVTSRLRDFLQTPDVRVERIRVDDLLHRLESTWKTFEPELSLQLDAGPLPVQADPWQLTRALVSILLHAQGRMRNDSALAIHVSRAEHEQLVHSIRILITYTTAHEDFTSMARIFEPSWSGFSPDLHNAYRLVKRMGGLVSARMEFGETAAFEIYLRCVDAATAGAPIPNSSEPAVLLVDASAEVRRLVHAHFERHGYRLLATSGWKEALLVAGLYPGDIPLAIANLPGGDESGDWLAEQLRSVRPGLRVRLLSGYSEPYRVAGQTLDAPSARHLTKWDLLEWAKQAMPQACEK